MFDVRDSLGPALARAQHRLEDASALTARANAAGSGAEAAMTQTARAALFTEALVAALHARLAEIKTAAKS